MSNKYSGPPRSSGTLGGTLVPGTWNDNPVTRRILRRAGFDLPDTQKKGRSDLDARTAAFPAKRP